MLEHIMWFRNHGNKHFNVSVAFFQTLQQHAKLNCHCVLCMIKPNFWIATVKRGIMSCCNTMQSKQDVLPSCPHASAWCTALLNTTIREHPEHVSWLCNVANMFSSSVPWPFLSCAMLSCIMCRGRHMWVTFSYRTVLELSLTVWAISVCRWYAIEIYNRG